MDPRPAAGARTGRGCEHKVRAGPQGPGQQGGRSTGPRPVPRARAGGATGVQGPDWQVVLEQLAGRQRGGGRTNYIYLHKFLEENGFRLMLFFSEPTMSAKRGLPVFLYSIDSESVTGNWILTLNNLLRGSRFGFYFPKPSLGS